LKKSQRKSKKAEIPYLVVFPNRGCRWVIETRGKRFWRGDRRGRNLERSRKWGENQGRSHDGDRAALEKPGSRAQSNRAEGKGRKVFRNAETNEGALKHVRGFQRWAFHPSFSA